VAVAVVELGAAGPLTRERIIRLLGTRGRQIAPGAALAEGTEAVVLIGGALVEPTCGPAIKRLAEEGAPVLALGAACAWACAAGLLPGRVGPPVNPGAGGATHLRMEGRPTPFTAAIPAGRVLPLAAALAGAFADAEVAALAARGQVLLRYCDEAGGLAPTSNVAGLCSERGNVVGIIPEAGEAHPPALGEELYRQLLASLELRLERR
jgi:phosphoribosylformylglycinamidine (FGAM) synthase-like amidotransferase family enzyme